MQYCHDKESRAYVGAVPDACIGSACIAVQQVNANKHFCIHLSAPYGEVKAVTLCNDCTVQSHIHSRTLILLPSGVVKASASVNVLLKGMTQEPKK
jgi:hypothetical protein